MKERSIPRIGQRIIKTTIAVLICLLVYYLIGYREGNIPSEACITVIICMQPYVKDTREYSINRILGTLVGSVWGLLLLLLLSAFPRLSLHFTGPYILMALGTMLSIYTSVLIGRSDSSSLAAIVFLCIVISFPNIDSPIKQTALRIADVFLGTFVAIAVNTFRLPRRKNEGLLFFLRTSDIIPDRFSNIDPAVLFRLNRLNDDGAKICLVSEHGPAFFAMQFANVKMNSPMIVMDGAAIYSPDENTYLWTRPIEEKNLDMLRKVFKDLGLSYFIYTIRKNKLCIFHHGSTAHAEEKVLERMRRSPYRDYLEGDVLDQAETVYFKILSEDEHIIEIEKQLHKALPERSFRIIRRPQEAAEGISGLYIYDHLATTGHARTVLLDMMRENGQRPEAADFTLQKGYRSANDAMHLLNLIERKYEPVSFMPKTRK